MCIEEILQNFLKTLQIFFKFSKLCHVEEKQLELGQNSMHRYLKTKISYSRIHIKGFKCCLLAMTPWLSLVTLVPAMFTLAWPLYTCNVYPCLAPVPAMFTLAWPLSLQCLPLPGPCTCNVYPCLALVLAMFTPAF